MRFGVGTAILLLATVLLTPSVSFSATRKTHTVLLGAVKKVAYSKAGDPAGAAAGEESLKIRALLVDGVVKEWTTGEVHDITDRSFVARRVIRLNDALPSDASAKNSARVANSWVWQRGPWLLIDRTSGHVTVLKLPDFDSGISQASWFRDYAAYCGLTSSGKSLYAVVAQATARKAALTRKLAAFDPVKHEEPVCGLVEWQREPMRVTFRPAGKDAVSFDFAPGSAVLVEGSSDDAASSDATAK
jgi:hypothetical protein